MKNDYESTAEDRLTDVEDLGFAAALHALGNVFWGINRVRSQSALLVFKDVEGAATLAQQYDADQLFVPARRYAASLRFLKLKLKKPSLAVQHKQHENEKTRITRK